MLLLIYLFINLFIYLLTFRFIYLFNHILIYLFINLFIYLSVHLHPKILQILLYVTVVAMLTIVNML